MEGSPTDGGIAQTGAPGSGAQFGHSSDELKHMGKGRNWPTFET